MKRLGTLATLLLLAAAAAIPCASAEGDGLGQFQASKAYVSGPTEGGSTLVGLAKLQGSGASALDKGEFQLDAQGLDMGKIESTATIYAGAVAYNQFPSGHWSQYESARIRSVHPKDDFELLVTPAPDAPAPTVHVSSSCSQLSTAGLHSDRIFAPRVDATRPPTTMRLDNAVVWQDCGLGSTLTIQGTMALSVWSWDFSLDSPNGHEAVPNGLLPLDDKAPASQNLGKARQVYMVAHNATLTIPLESTGQDGLYVSAVAVSGAAGIVLMDAQGAMDASGQNDPVSGSRVQFTGELGLQVVSASAGLPLRLNVGGNLQKLDVDGHVQTFSGKVSPDLPVLGASSAVLVGAVLVAAGAGAGFVVLRRRSRPGPDSVLQDGFDALQLGQWRRALRLARRAVKAEPLDADAHYLLGRSLAEAGRLRQALHHHERTQELLHGSRGVDGPLIAENAAAAAKATARLHAQAKGEETDSLHVRVLEWLRAAIEADPAMPSQLAVQPELVPFLRQIPLAKPDVPFWAKP